MSESRVSVARGDGKQVHNDEHNVVTPAIAPRFAPEGGVPSKYFLFVWSLATVKSWCFVVSRHGPASTSAQRCGEPERFFGDKVQSRSEEYFKGAEMPGGMLLGSR